MIRSLRLPPYGSIFIALDGPRLGWLITGLPGVGTHVVLGQASRQTIEWILSQAEALSPYEKLQLQRALDTTNPPDEPV